jgi:hypothetical protein
MPGHRDGAAILDRDAEDLRLGPEMQRDLVRDRGGQDVAGRAPIRRRGPLGGVDLGFGIDALGPHEREVGILNVVELSPSDPVEPQVRHHAVDCRISAGRQGRVTHDGLGVGVAVMGVDEVHTAVEQAAEPVIPQMPPISVDQIPRSWSTVICRTRRGTSREPS